ncbi:hypothetical protein V8C40DRAFT_151463 [Trichoderma camerunense]
MAYNLFPAKSFPYPILPCHAYISCFIISYMLIPCPICHCIPRLPLYRFLFLSSSLSVVFSFFFCNKGNKRVFVTTMSRKGAQSQSWPQARNV